MSREVEELIEELDSLNADRRILVEERDAETATTARLIEEAQARIEAEQALLRTLRAKVLDESPDLSADIADADLRIATLRERIKREIRKLSPRALSEGLEYVRGGLRVKVNRAQIVETYDAQGMIDEEPALESLAVDGDRLVQRTINGAILRRLLVRGEVDEDLAERHRTTSIARAPSVRFEEVGRGDAA